VRPLLLLTLASCSLSPSRPPRAEPLQIEARLAQARHAAETELSVYVWPSSEPPEDLTHDDARCAWWQGRRAGRDLAHAGLADGTLRWGAIAVTLDGVSFAGERLVPLQDGRPADDAHDGATLHALSAALVRARAIQDAWHEVCGEVYRDRPLLLVDADVPAATVGLALQTAAGLRFPRVAAMVVDPDPERRPTLDPEDPGHLAVIRQRGDRAQVLSPAADRRIEGPLTDLEPMITRALAGRRYGCTMLVAEAGSRWEHLAGTIDLTQAFRTTATFATFNTSGPPEQAPPPERLRTPRTGLNPDNRASVLWLDLPNIAWRAVDEVRCDAFATGALGAELPLPETLEIALATPPPDQTRARMPVATRDRPLAARVALAATGPISLGEPDDPAEPIRRTLQVALACADQAADRPDAPDEIAIAFQVGPDGAPAHPYSASFSPSDPIHGCLREALDAIGRFDPLGEDRHAVGFIGIGVRSRP